jgi:hypothetical protein
MLKVHKKENIFGSDFEFCTILLLVIVSRLVRVWLQSLKKVLILKNSKKVSKNAKFQADFRSVDKVFKKCTKKSY